MPRHAYFDASAIVKLIVREPETAALEHYSLTLDSLLTSRLGIVETTRAVGRAGARRLLQQMADVLEAFVTVDVMRAILARAAEVDPPALRTLDAIHLATALSFEFPVEFVTYDQRLADAASAAGLVVRQPR